MTKLNDNFLEEIYAIISEVPEGCVATYGQIARLSGHPKNSRLVGTALKLSEFYGNYPCHRIVNSKGRLVPGWREQKTLLLKENITFKNDLVDLKKHQWLK